MASNKHGNGLAHSEAAEVFGTAPARRDRAKHLKLQLSPIHRRALVSAGLSDGALAGKVAVRRQVVQAWGSPEEPHLPNVAHLATGPSEWALAWLREIVGQHQHHVAPAPAVVHGDDHAKRLASVTVACSGPASALATALVDRVFTVPELELIVQRARESTAATVELEAAAMAQLQALRSKR